MHWSAVRNACLNLFDLNVYFCAFERIHYFHHLRHVLSFFLDTLFYHIPSRFLSLNKEEPLPELSPQALAILGHAGPMRQIRCDPSVRNQSHVGRVRFPLRAEMHRRAHITDSCFIECITSKIC